MSDSIKSVNWPLVDVARERRRQDEKFGDQSGLPNGTCRYGDQADMETARNACEERFKAGVGSWRDILAEEYHEALAEMNQAKLREELIQVAAVAVAWVEAIDKREGK